MNRGHGPFLERGIVPFSGNLFSNIFLLIALGGPLLTLYCTALVPLASAQEKKAPDLSSFRERVKDLLLEDFVFRVPLHTMKDLFCEEWESWDWKKELEDRNYANYEDYEKAARLAMDKIVDEMIQWQRKKCRLLGEGPHGERTQVNNFVFSKTDEGEETELEESAGKDEVKGQYGLTWKLTLGIMMSWDDYAEEYPLGTFGSGGKRELAAERLQGPSVPLAISLEIGKEDRIQLQESNDTEKKEIKEKETTVLRPEMGHLRLDLFYLKTLPELRLWDRPLQVGGGFSYRQQTQIYALNAQTFSPTKFSTVALNLAMGLKKISQNGGHWEYLFLYLYGLNERGNDEAFVVSSSYHEVYTTMTFYPFPKRSINFFMGPLLRLNWWNMTLVPSFGGQTDSLKLSSREISVGGVTGVTF